MLGFLPQDLQSATIEIVPYFTDSFGNSSRIDYGTGHETNFAAWLYCLALLGLIKEEDYQAVVARVFVKYLELMRKLQLVYCLEPAGSHGVWGLDDYHFLPFIFGSAQLIDHKYMKPKSIHNDDILDNFSNEYLYLSCIAFVKKVKKGVFAEHSPMLDDISGVPNWNKVNGGMLKMYKAEVLEKVPIMQHFLFGWLIKWVVWSLVYQLCLHMVWKQIEVFSSFTGGSGATRRVKLCRSNALTAHSVAESWRMSSNGNRFWRILRQSFASNLNLGPLETDWVKDENKYGCYDSIVPISFQNQIFEGPDTDIETGREGANAGRFSDLSAEMHLANARQTKIDDTTDDDIPSTSGRQFTDATFSDSSHSKVSKHLGESPLPAYEPVFDWENVRSMIFGQQNPETHKAQYGSGLKISLKVLSLAFRAGLVGKFLPFGDGDVRSIFVVEPFYGTICLYNRERRDKLSEDFIFRVLPAEMRDNTSVCLLIQLEKPATEKAGVTPSVYSLKEQVFTLPREKSRNYKWSQIMPYKESFAWAIVPLFDNNIAAASGGSASSSSPLAPSVSGSSSQDGVSESSAKIALDGKPGYLCGSSVVVEISNLNKVKERYTEDSLQVRQTSSLLMCWTWFCCFI
ncbi:unnamed protein product [Camellia sinensis]